MKTLICSFTILLFASCQRDKTQEFLEIYYMAPGINTPFDYSCGMISKEFLKEELNYKKITDKKSVQSFIKMYKGYEKSIDSTGMNARIKVLVHNENVIDTLCMGEYFNTYKNGVKVRDKQEVLDYVKKIIDYSNTTPSFVKKHPERFKLHK